MMIQCDRCNVWQHGACVGIPTEKETPDGALTRSLASYWLTCSLLAADTLCAF